MLCTTLAKVQRSHVRFDPHNREHLDAYEMLCIGDSNGVIRQHPTLRFYLEDGYSDVRSMMSDVVGREYLRIFN